MLVLAALPLPAAAADETAAVSTLARQTHFHGLAVDANDPMRLFLATHHGIYAVGQDGMARRISEATNDHMGFTPHPTDRLVLFSSGHPPEGGNLGFMTSADGGRSWRKLADGVGGPVDFHQMDVSKANPNVIWGVYRGLQRSADGGRSWAMVGPAPEGIIDLAASSRDVSTLYAATQRGLLRSTDSGRSWSPAHLVQRPATLVRTTRAGEVYAFIVGTGLVRAKEDGLAWETLSSAFGDSYVVHLAVDPTDTRRLYVVTLDAKAKAQLPALLASRDGGANWKPLGAP
jgi:photosystem II stability/assembly factor-like uncharacterized protein